jgi:hypothetical protein
MTHQMLTVLSWLVIVTALVCFSSVSYQHFICSVEKSWILAHRSFQVQMEKPRTWEKLGQILNLEASFSYIELFR